MPHGSDPLQDPTGKPQPQIERNEMQIAKKPAAESCLPSDSGLHEVLLLTRAEVARCLKVHVRTINRWVQTDVLPHPVCLGPRIKRWPVESVKKALENRPQRRPGKAW